MGEAVNATGEAEVRPAECVLGDCSIQLTHATTYEPPLYLFPELLPRVAQGSAPAVVWDAVADAVNVGASSWNLADVSRLCAAAAASEAQDKTVRQTGRPSTVTTLASLISANRLVAAGLSARVLRDGNGFSAASMMEELLRLRAHAGLSEEEGTIIMSNHFVNLLAWKKLREINHAAAPATSGCESVTSRKRPRRQQEEDHLDALRAAPDPWSDVVDDPAHAGVYVSGREENVQERVSLLATLGALYRRPWRTLRSQGQQTDHVVPPGTINTTSPYANQTATPEAMVWLDANGPCATTAEAADKGGWDVRFVVMIRSATQTSLPPCVVPLRGGRTYYFGRSEGLQHSPRTGAVDVDVGLGRYSDHAEYIAALHFALLTRPAAAGEKEDELWLVGYGGNGTRVLGSRWVLGQPQRLRKGSELLVAHDVHVRVLTEDEEVSAGSATRDVRDTVVKAERAEEDE